MKTLVTGGAGFIGSFVVDRLLSEGQDVRVVDNLDPQVHPAGRPAYLPDVELRVVDVRDLPAMVDALEDVDAVVHCAAAVGVGQSLYRVKHYVDVNVGGTATLLQALIEPKQQLRKLVVLTSMTGYGEGVYKRLSDGKLMQPSIRTEEDIRRFGWEPRCPETGEELQPVPTPEDADMSVHNIYALTKRYQEELVMSLADIYGWPAVCFRLFNVYGPRQSLSNPYTGVLAIFISRLEENQPPVIYEDGNQTRDFVSVHDVSQAVMLGLRSSSANGQIINTWKRSATTDWRVCGRTETLARERFHRASCHPQVSKGRYASLLC